MSNVLHSAATLIAAFPPQNRIGKNCIRYTSSASLRHLASSICGDFRPDVLKREQLLNRVAT